MSQSPTQRSLELARKMGWIADVCERWVPMKNHPGGGQRKDLFGFLDVVALTPYGILGIQACARASHKNRMDKAILAPELKEWLRMRAGFVVWSWAKTGKPLRWGVKAQGIVYYPGEDIGPHRLEPFPHIVGATQEDGPGLSGIHNAG